jgi:hypothetical protein
MPLATRNLQGLGRVAWVDGAPETVRDISDVLDTGRRCVVSITDYFDHIDIDDLDELRRIVEVSPAVEFIVATAGWCNDQGRVQFKELRALAASPAVSLGLICSHRTGLVRVRNAAVCWDYSCGTPRFVYRKEDGIIQSAHIIGSQDWLAMARAARSIPDAHWFDFGK